jgi:subtilisin family serine protease
MKILLLFAFFAASDEKIDPRVQESLKRKSSVDVILLGKSQLLEGHSGFLAFCRKNRDRKRSDLRREGIEKLKTIAAEEQEGILDALGNPPGGRRLWLVNAISVRLTSEQIGKASKLPSVKYIYMGRRVLKSGAREKVETVIVREERKPFSPEGKKIPWNLKAIGVDRVWKEWTGEGIVVAILDSGVRYTHVDLRRNIWINPGEIPNNGKDDDENGHVDDLYGYDFGRNSPRVMARESRQGVEHGTVTAGIVAGDGTGGTVTGVAPRAKIMVLKAGGTFGVALAWQYALENGADIVNMSFSIPGLGALRGFWRLMADQATCLGLVLVSGAGNFQKSEKVPTQIRIPEGIPSVICAGGVNRDMSLPGFVSLGPVEWGSVPFYEDFPLPEGLVKPDACGFPGPGYPLLSSTEKNYLDPNRSIKGNSFSSPHVSGVAALVLSANPELPAWRVKEIIGKTATDLGEEGKDSRTGAGLLNAPRAVEAAKE